MGRLAWIAVLVVGVTASGCVRRGNYECRASAECTLNGAAGTCEPIGFCSFPDPDCATGRRYGEYSDRYANQCVDAVMVEPDAEIDTIMIDAFPSACPVPVTSRHVWTIDLPLDAEWNTQADVPYSPDHRSALAAMAYTRVAYCLQLNATYVYVEMDDFTAGSIADTGIPTEAVFDVTVANLTIRTNSPSVTEVTDGAGGSIELWGHCYSAGPQSVFDYDDTISAAQPDCYGSFQVHHNTTSALAFNRWSNGGSPDDLGIGNASTGNPDWTFASNAASFTTRRLEAFIVP